MGSVRRGEGRSYKGEGRGKEIVGWNVPKELLQGLVHTHYTLQYNSYINCVYRHKSIVYACVPTRLVHTGMPWLNTVL